MSMQNLNNPFSPTHTFEQFILNSKSTILTTYQRESVTIDKNTNTVIKKKYFVNLDRWYPILDSHFKGFTLDEELRGIIALYCDLVSSYYDNKLKLMSSSLSASSEISLSYQLSRIFNKIPKRSRIVDKYYNYELGISEYLLEDGSYVPMDDNKSQRKLVNFDIDLIPDEILPLIDINEYRNNKIDKII